MDCSLAGVSSSTVVQEDLPIAGMAECDKWTVFFAFAICLVAHIDIYAYIFSQTTDHSRYSWEICSRKVDVCIKHMKNLLPQKYLGALCDCQMS
jgi:hypothetical protein